MSEPFQPPHEDLPPLADLMELASVTQEDVQAAADKWLENPPDEEFRNVLNAEDDTVEERRTNQTI